MTRAELIEAVADRGGASRALIKAILEDIADVAHEALASGVGVDLPGFGKFAVAERAARAGHNPRDGAPIDIAAKRVPKFTAAKALRDAIPQPAPQPKQRKRA